MSNFDSKSNPHVNTLLTRSLLLKKKIKAIRLQASPEAGAALKTLPRETLVRDKAPSQRRELLYYKKKN